PDLDEIPGFYQVNNGNFWIAKIEDKVIGTIALLDIGNNKGALRKMFVAKDYRGKESGIGQTLLNTLVAWARQKGITEIFLGTTEKFIAAQRFYEKNGFVEIPKQSLPKEFPVMDVDVKFYKFSVIK
ncbi:MAG TPA: GNAT family N-acetyltransferase, partial [Chitinophagaceae bacterium]